MVRPAVDHVSRALAQQPLLVADRTYNTAHPAYDANLVRNHPGRIFNHTSTSANPIFRHIRGLARGAEIPDGAWQRILRECLAEAASVPGAAQLFQRKAFMDAYAADLDRRHGAMYQPGWVNLDDALFLYWVVRKLDPRVVVQTGVCNGLSTAFMVLALVKNGGGGIIHAIDLPRVFDPADPAWTRAGTVYGVMIPQGHRSGWMVPDLHRDRVTVVAGDARHHLPPLVDELGVIDLFFHDSDHTYDHMTFELAEVARKLRPGGVILADDIAWTSSLWDFADGRGVPSYNHQGSVGAAFF